MITTLTSGAIFARDFRVVGRLREGGMGAVYVVDQLSTGKQRALKVLSSDLAADPVTRERLVLEARVGSQIDSDHVVEVVTAGVDEGTGLPYLVMELLKGEDLGEALGKRGSFSPLEVGEILMQVGHALERAHAQGIVHRDLKPENLYLSPPRRPDAAFMVKILDFGVAKLITQSARPGTQVLGTPHFMAPEQTDRDGRITPACDVWALGLIAFVLLTGRDFWKSAHKGSIAALLREALFEPIPRASERALELGSPIVLPPGFDAWFARCVVRDVSERYPEAGIAVRRFHELVLNAPLAPMRASLGSIPERINSPSPMSVSGAPAGLPRAETIDLSLGDDLLVPRSTKPKMVELEGESSANQPALELDIPGNERLRSPAASRMAAAAVASSRRIAGRAAPSPVRSSTPLIAGGVLLALALAGGVLWAKRPRPSDASAAPLAVVSAASTGAPMPDDAARRARACDASRSRLSAGASMGPFDTSGWYVELWLARPAAKGDLASDPALAALVGSGQLGAGVDATLAAQKDGAVELDPGMAPRELGRVPGWPSVTVRFRGGYVAPFFDPEGRPRYVALADRLAAASAATMGALYARCAHLRFHDLGAWFRGSDAPSAAVALLYGAGAFAEPAVFDAGKLTPPGSELDALRRLVGRTDEAALGAATTAQGGVVSRDPDGRAFTIRFPQGLTRAAAASRVLGAKLAFP